MKLRAYVLYVVNLQIRLRFEVSPFRLNHAFCRNNSAMSSPLTLKHVFGLKGDAKDNIHFVDEANVLYPAGYNIIVYNIENKTLPQRFLPLGSSHAHAHSTTTDAKTDSAPATAAPAPTTVSPAKTADKKDSAASVQSPPPTAGPAPGTAVSRGAEHKGGAADSTLAGGDVSALTVSSSKGAHTHSRSKLLAVAERGAFGKPTVSVYDLATFKRRGKGALSTSEVCFALCFFVSVCFSFLFLFLFLTVIVY